MKIIAHRGLHNNVVCENTFVSIKRAFNNKNFVGVELDVRMTKDKHIVVIHDSTINRTSDSTGLVKNMTLSELKKINFGSKNYYQTIPTLDGILNLINTNKIFLIELKDKDSIFISQFIKIIERHKDKNIYVMSFNENAIDEIDFKYKGIIKFKLLSNSIIGKYKFFTLYYKFININTIKLLIKRRKKVFIWTINYKNKLISIKKLGKYYNKCYLISDELL